MVVVQPDNWCKYENGELSDWGFTNPQWKRTALASSILTLFWFEMLSDNHLHRLPSLVANFLIFHSMSGHHWLSSFLPLYHSTHPRIMEEHGQSFRDLARYLYQCNLSKSLVLWPCKTNTNQHTLNEILFWLHFSAASVYTHNDVQVNENLSIE